VAQVKVMSGADDRQLSSSSTGGGEGGAPLPPDSVFSIGEDDEWEEWEEDV
jgi:hypothetical protein